MEGQVDLVLRFVALFGDGRFGLVKSIIFHHSLDARESAVEFLLRVKFAELQAGRAGQLVGGRIGGHTFDRHHADKVIGDGQKAQAHAGGGGAVRFGLNVGEASGGKKGLHGVVQVFARESCADFERRRRQQRSNVFR